MAPANFCFYTSGYGYGHATRDIALLRELKARFPDSKFYLRTAGNLEFLRASLPFAQVSKSNDLFSAVAGSGLGADPSKTRKGLSLHEKWLNEESKFCRRNKISAILSDISPQPFPLARKLGIRAYAFSNFTWHLIYEDLFGSCKESDEVLKMYSQADLAFALPLSEPMRQFARKKNVNLVSRKPTRSRSAIRRLLGICESDLLVYYGTGFSPKDTRSTLTANCSFELLVSRNSTFRGRGVHRIPSNDPESQDYIAACDLAVTKASYGVCSEAIAGRIPMMLCERSGFCESKYILNETERLGICLRMSVGDFLNGRWIEKAGHALGLKKNYAALPERYSPNGAVAIAKELASS